MTAKAIDLGIWYEDDDGNLIKEALPGGKYDEQSENYILRLEALEPEVVAQPAKVYAKPLRPLIQPPKGDDDIQFNSGWKPRTKILKSTPEEDARLIAEGIARGTVTVCPPGYARNIK